MFNIRNIGKTLVTRTQGTKIASDGLKGHVFAVSPADLQNDEAAFRKFKLITEDTIDGYLLRLFCVGFTKKHNDQIQKASYAQHQQVRQIRKKMMEILT
ncbi:hypothetical protein EI555_015103 [Monodon monoceros]|uniref:Uncharacterized protein n=1 Tax=Monodon monoceros TaxID=40151 RepID=A0A4U1EY53_MONMO|nr:hypothetical protein EI555_015103 [Monodon monoceros]